jgi:hypothetical protein
VAFRGCDAGSSGGMALGGGYRRKGSPRRERTETGSEDRLPLMWVPLFAWLALGRRQRHPWVVISVSWFLQQQQQQPDHPMIVPYVRDLAEKSRE